MFGSPEFTLRTKKSLIRCCVFGTVAWSGFMNTIRSNEQSDRSFRDVNISLITKELPDRKENKPRNYPENEAETRDCE